MGALENTSALGIQCIRSASAAQGLFWKSPIVVLSVPKHA